MRVLIKILKWFLIVLLILNLAVIISGRTYLYKGVANTYLKGRSGPSIQEYPIFANRLVKAGTPQPWPKSVFYNKTNLNDSLKNDIVSYNPIAYLVLKNDSILYEQYWDVGSVKSVTNSFSMAKSILGVLTGIAIKDGKIKSVDESIGNYLPQFKEGEKSKITIKHLLTMSSGMAFDEDYVNPFAYPAEAYYGSDLESLTYKYDVATEPGKIFKYLSGDSQLLAFVIKAATGMNVSEYASEKLWKPVGAEADALWNLDKENGWEKSFCCFNSNARDFARFGSLYNHFGNWKGNQIIDSVFVAAATHSNGLIDEEGKPCDNYGYQWWIMNYKGMHVPYMRGILGQYVITIPEKNLVIVRLGHKRSKFKTAEGYPKDIVALIEQGLSISKSFYND